MHVAASALATTWRTGSLVQVEIEDSQGLYWRYLCKVAWQVGQSVGLRVPGQALLPDDLSPGRHLPIRSCRLGDDTVTMPATIGLSPYATHTLILSLESPD